MSIIKFGVAVVGIRGTIGGITFSANKHGPYARAWSKGSHPATPRQTDQQSYLAQMPALWQALTPVQRTAWDVFAALGAQDLINSLGETYSISGFGWFCKINIRLLVMGRAARVAVPVQARPAAPTITDLEFPLGPGQTAFVEYPSAEFDPDFDLVLEAAQASSVAGKPPPTDFKEVAVLQDPNDTETGFAQEYANRFGTGNTGLKGFVRLYRQTTDGLRSAPAAADFVAGDGTNYAPGALDYDGMTDWAVRAGGLTGAANTETCTIVGWFKVDGGNGDFRTFFGNTANHYNLRLTTANKLQFLAETAGGVAVVNIISDATFTAGIAWHAFAISVNLDTPVAQMVIDGAIDDFQTITLTQGGIMDFDQATYQFGSRVGAAQPWDGCLSSFWLDVNSSLDIHDPAVLTIFFSRDNGPQFLGSTGQLPTGATPVIYFPDGDAEDNVGEGENFINAGPIDPCGTTP